MVPACHFGEKMPSTQPLPRPAHHDPIQVYENLAGFGDYSPSTKHESWSQDRVFPDGQRLRLFGVGAGKRPTAQQVSLWNEFDACLDEWISVAIAAVPPPP